MDDNYLWTVAEKTAIEFGLVPDSNGFFYICHAVALSLKIGKRKAGLYKEIYAEIAKTNDVTEDSVEKCIRYCIRACWSNRKQFQNKVRYYDSELIHAPTNGELIALITSRLRLERRLIF